jgi:pimeloyl-ACP methyl ester carboxylesterase
MKVALTYIIVLFTAALLFTSCKKGAATLSTGVDEFFWLTNKGADMPVWVKGNTASKIILLFLHGGPGIGAHRYSGFQTNQLQVPYAVAYWDQRDAGAAAGNNNMTDLTLDMMIEDLEKLIEVLKYRYGSDTEIFLMGHSFGGLLGSGFLVKGDNQKNIRGWIQVDGAHDYPETNILSRQMLIDSAATEIAKGKYVSEWTTIRDYCTGHQPNVSLDVSYRINVYAHDVEDYVDINHTKTPIEYASPSSPVSFGINLYHMYYTDAGKHFLQSLEDVGYTNQLYKIKIPSLLIWGQYDFNVPVGSGKHALEQLGSAYKQLHIMPHSGHTPMNGDTDLFAETVIGFVEAVR